MKGFGKIKKIAGNIMNTYDSHQREVKLGMTVAGVVLTGIAAARAAIKVEKIISEARYDIQDLEANQEFSLSEDEFKEKKKEITISTLKKVAPVVIPPVVIGSATIWSAVSGYNSASRQITALSAAYSLTENSFTQFQDKAKEMLGEKKVQEIKDKVNETAYESTPKNEVIRTGKGEVLCLDEASGRYFYSSAEAIKKAFNEVNKQMMDEYYVSFNEYYDKIGLPPITLGDDLGFNIDQGLIDIDHIFTAVLNEKDEVVLIVNVDEYVSTRYMENRGRTIR